MKPKKLNLDKIWKLYLLLKPSIDNRKQESMLLDEVDKIIELASPKVLLECIHLMYDNKVEFSDMQEFTVLFLRAIDENNFFDFVEFIRGLDGTPRK